MPTGALCLFCAALALLEPSTSRAADTIEPYDRGPSDCELYAGVEGLGLSTADRTHSAEWVLGYGLSDVVSLFVQGGSAADGHLSAATGAWSLGAYALLLDTVHLDLDVGASVGSDDASYGYSPFLELNLDVAPNQEVAGSYFLVEPFWYGQQDAEGRSAAVFAASATVGEYLTLGDAHQLLVEMDGTHRAAPAAAERRWELGALHLGYNVYLSDSLELVSELSVDLPQTGDSWSLGAFTGVIATLP